MKRQQNKTIFLYNLFVKFDLIKSLEKMTRSTVILTAASSKISGVATM